MVQVVSRSASVLQEYHTLMTQKNAKVVGVLQDGLVSTVIVSTHFVCLRQNAQVFGIDCKQECRCAAGVVFLADTETAMVAFSYRMVRGMLTISVSIHFVYLRQKAL